MKRGKIIIPLLIAVMLAGCGSKSSNDMASSDNKSSSQEYDEMVKAEGEMWNTGETPMDEQAETSDSSSFNYKKIIDTANLTIESVEFDKALETLKKNLEETEGYMESSNINQPGVGSNNYKSYRNGDFVVRIPKENFQGFLKSAEKIGVITNESTGSKDITKEYYDTETRLKVYEAQEARYIELLNEAKTMEDILTIEKQLTEVRYNIEYLAGYKNEMKDLVDYGTVTIYLYEVAEPTKVIEAPKNLGDKIINAFMNSLISLKYVCTALILIIVSIIPYGIILGILVWIAFYLYKKIKKNVK